MSALHTIATFPAIETLFNLREFRSANIHSIELCGFRVHTDSQRYRLFQLNRRCVWCGVLGTEMRLQTLHQKACVSSPVLKAHFNLYSDTNTLLTKDHIQPHSKGGRNHLSNYQTMCVNCNLDKFNMPAPESRFLNPHLPYSPEERLNQLQMFPANRRQLGRKQLHF